MADELMALVVVERKTTQVVVSEPVVFQRVDLVLACRLPVTLRHRQTISISLSPDKPL